MAITPTLAAWFAPQVLIGVAVSFGINIAVVSSWKTTTEHDIASLKAYRLVATQDHDNLIRIGSDVVSIKEALIRIERRMHKDLASGSQ